MNISKAISFEDLKVIKLAPYHGWDHEGEHSPTEVRVRKTFIEFICKDVEFEFRKKSDNNGGCDLALMARGPGKDAFAYISITWEQAEAFKAWLDQGEWIPPARKKCTRCKR